MSDGVIELMAEERDSAWAEVRKAVEAHKETMAAAKLAARTHQSIVTTLQVRIDELLRDNKRLADKLAEVQLRLYDATVGEVGRCLRRI